MEIRVSDLIDQLSIVNVKLYHLVDAVEDKSQDDKTTAANARKIVELNKQRSQLRNAIENAIGNGDVEVKL